MLYISAYRTYEYKGSWLPEKCGLWIAGYPYIMTDWPDSEDLPYNTSPWEFAAIWQFTRDLVLPGYVGKLDGDIAYMDVKAWSKYAKSSKTSSSTTSKPARKTCEELAKEVIAGKWGNGWNRKQALDSAYGKGTYDHVQTIVDNMLGLDGC